MTKYTAMINVERSTYEAHMQAFPEVDIPSPRNDWSNYQAALDAAAKSTADWQWYRFYEGAVNTGCIEHKYAISVTLGRHRSLTTGEYYNLNSCSHEYYEQKYGKIADPLDGLSSAPSA